MANHVGSDPMAGGLVEAAIARRDEDLALIGRYMAIARRLYPNEPSSFTLVEIDDLTPQEQHYMAESLRQFAKEERAPLAMLPHDSEPK